MVGGKKRRSVSIAWSLCSHACFNMVWFTFETNVLKLAMSFARTFGMKGKSKVTQILQSPAVARTVPKFSTSNPSGDRGVDSRSEAPQWSMCITLEAHRYNNIIHACDSILQYSLYMQSLGILLPKGLVLGMVHLASVMGTNGEGGQLAWAPGLPVVE